MSQSDQGSNPIREALRSILISYGELSSYDFGGESYQEAYVNFDQLRYAFKDGVAPIIRLRFAKKIGIGKGKWAKVPWVGFETNPNRQGLCIYILFREDMTGFYVTCGAKFIDGPLAQIRDFARPPRAFFSPYLKDTGFFTDANVDLRLSGPSIAAKYPDATVAHRLYTGPIPKDQDFLVEILPLLVAYKKYQSRDCR